MDNLYYLYSGSLAIETVLLNEFKGTQARVVLPNNTCHRVLLAVMRAGCKPVLVAPSNGFVLTSKDIQKLLDDGIKFDAVILVFQYGLYINVDKIRKVCKSAVLIADVSQTIIKNEVTKSSDYVVGSFNKSKPLSIGFGGFIITNNKLQCLDYENKESRYSDKMLLPYVLQNVDFNVNKLQKTAAKKIKYKKRVIEKIINNFKSSDIAFFKDNYDFNTYNRFPVIFKEKTKARAFEDCLKNNKIKYELQHVKLLHELPVLNENKEFYDLCENKYEQVIYLKLNDQKISGVRKWLKKSKR